MSPFGDGQFTVEDKATMLAVFVGLMLGARTLAAFLQATGLAPSPVDLSFLDQPMALFIGALLIYLKPPNDQKPPENP